MYINTSYQNQFNRNIYNDEFKPTKIQQFNGYLANAKATKFTDLMQRKYSNNSNFSNDEPYLVDDQASLCSSLSSSFSSISPTNIYNPNEKNSSNSSFDESLFSSSSSSLSSSSSSLSFISPVWTSALYSPCLHSNLFRTWSTNLMDHDHYNELNDDSYTRSFSLSSYSLDSRNSKKLDEYFNTDLFYDYNRFLNDQYEDDNGQYLISYQEINKKINDLLNSNDNTKTKEDNTKLKEITNSNKTKFKDYFRDAIHVNTLSSKNSANNDVDLIDENLVHMQNGKSTSPKPKFIAPRFEKKWLENQNNFNDYASKNQLIKQTNIKAIMKTHNYDNSNNANNNTMAISSSTNIKTNNNNNINTNKKMYQQTTTNTKQSQLNYFKRNNLLSKNTKYINQKPLSIPKRTYQCKCLNNNNNKCTCCSTNTLSTMPNAYTNENEFYSNRNLNTSNYNAGYNYIHTQQNYNTNQNQNRYRYSTKSRT